MEMKWISTDDKLPEKELVVIVYVPQEYFGLRSLGYLSEDNIWYSGVRKFTSKVTHWMPLPEPPKN